MLIACPEPAEGESKHKGGADRRWATIYSSITILLMIPDTHKAN